MITLPTPPRRAHLRSFWIALSIILGLIVLFFLRLLSYGHPQLLALATVFGFVIAGVIFPEWVRPFYSLWNKAARRVARSTTPTLSPNAT